MITEQIKKEIEDHTYIGDHDPFNYFPLSKDGINSSTAKMRKMTLNKDDPKERIFQIDGKFHDYRKSKKLLKTSFACQDITDSILSPINIYMIHRLLMEYPNHFGLERYNFRSYITGKEMGVNARPKEFFQFIANQVQEDLVIHCVDPKAKKDWAAVIELSHPNGWSAEGAIGRNFEYIHQGVPNIKKLIPKSYAMALNLTQLSSPIERVGAISFRDNTKLNRHPDVAKSCEFNPQGLWMRFERQTATGFPELNAFLFTIKTYFIAVNNSDKNKRDIIIKALEADHSKTYHSNFLDENKERILKWLEA